MDTKTELPRVGITIRPATDGDIEWLMLQLVAFSTFYGTKRKMLGDDMDVNRHIMDTMIHQHPFFVAEGIHGRMGFISGVMVPHVFNPAIRLLSETFWWVDPKFRGSRAASLLLEKFLEWGKQNADMITLALEENSPIDERHLTKLGFHLHERSFMLEVV